jgi:MscS family membrane protein
LDLVETWFAAAASIALLRPAAAFLVFLLFLLLRGILTRFVFGLASKIAARSKTRIDISFFLALENPLKNFILVLGIYIALSILLLTPPLRYYLTVIFRILIVVFAAWAFYNLCC